MNNPEIRIAQAEYLIKKIRSSLSWLEGQRDGIVEKIGIVEDQIDTLGQQTEHALQARVLFEHLTDQKREMVRSKIEDLVTFGIQAVFGPSYQFKIEQTLSRNQVAFKYKIIHEFGGEMKESDLRGAHGGGLVALVGFLLRLVMVLFVHPPRRRIIFLDETMAALDGDKRDPFARLLATLGSTLDCQFVIITHSPEYSEAADVTYRVESAGQGMSKLVRQ